jgi:hypothetical protein
MTNQVLGQLAIEEIREAMRGLCGPVAKYEAEHIAAFYNISISRVYDITRDLRPRRKRRADEGNRAADLLENEGLRFAAELVALKKVDAKFALERARTEGYAIPVSLGTFRRYLREHQISRSQLRSRR